MLNVFYMKNSLLLKFDSVSKSYPVYSSILRRVMSRKLVLEKITFELEEGKVLGVLGASGSGKTTIAKLITKIEEEYSGRIILNNINIKNMTHKELAKNVSMVFQNPYSSLNPKHKIRFVLEERINQYAKLYNNKIDNYEIKEHILELLNYMKLPAEILSCYPHQLSGGQKQRIAILCAIILKPKLLILDEPLSSLDISLQAQILNYLIDIKQKYNLTYIFITHDQDLAEYFCDNIIKINKGVICENN